MVAGCGSSSPASVDAPALSFDAPLVDAPPVVLGNRDRLLVTYLAFLQSTTTRQTNGLLGSELADVCALWTELAPSAQATFLTITARLEGSVIAADASTMLDHVTRLYRAVGGDGSSATAPGSCGGGEANRLVMQMDPELHAVLVTANHDKGMTGGQTELRDIPTGHFWRESHDLNGAHVPFDLSDETDDGAPRGQLQFFELLTSAAATSALRRQDLATLVDPLALEMDEDFDCAHNSNPACNYTLYGALCAPQPNLAGTAIYQETYGDYGASFKPTGCP